MKQRPILMTSPLVREILAGNKTQTRRPVKFPDNYTGEIDKVFDNSPDLFGLTGLKYPGPDETMHRLHCPYGDPGDGLWLKEGFYAYGYWVRDGITKTGKQKYKFIDTTLEQFEYIYQADTTLEGCKTQFNTTDIGWHKRNSLFMPRTASRITLEILQIGVERLHDISEEDAKAEGVEPILEGSDKRYIDSFYYKWREIYGNESFTSNPWVWKIRFRRVEQ